MFCEAYLRVTKVQQMVSEQKQLVRLSARKVVMDGRIQILVKMLAILNSGVIIKLMQLIRLKHNSKVKA